MYTFLRGTEIFRLCILTFAHMMCVIILMNGKILHSCNRMTINNNFNDTLMVNWQWDGISYTCVEFAEEDMYRWEWKNRRIIRIEMMKKAAQTHTHTLMYLFRVLYVYWLLLDSSWHRFHIIHTHITHTFYGPPHRLIIMMIFAKKEENTMCIVLYVRWEKNKKKSPWWRGKKATTTVVVAAAAATEAAD